MGAVNLTHFILLVDEHCCWNVRGMNKVYKQKELKVFIQENKVGLMAITETRV